MTTWISHTQILNLTIIFAKGLNMTKGQGGGKWQLRYLNEENTDLASAGFCEVPTTCTAMGSSTRTSESFTFLC